MTKPSAQPREVAKRVQRHRDLRTVAGGRQVNVWLTPEASDALDTLVVMHGSIREAINKALIDAVNPVLQG